MYTNEDRLRYYGLRVGDEISYASLNNNKIEGYVAALDPMDNNKVLVAFKDGNLNWCVAEWCKIINKVEDLEKIRLEKIREIEIYQNALHDACMWMVYHLNEDTLLSIINKGAAIKLDSLSDFNHQRANQLRECFLNRSKEIIK